jgi:hypothetical protein
MRIKFQADAETGALSVVCGGFRPKSIYGPRAEAGLATLEDYEVLRLAAAQMLMERIISPLPTIRESDPRAI